MNNFFFLYISLTDSCFETDYRCPAGGLYLAFPLIMFKATYFAFILSLTFLSVNAAAAPVITGIDGSQVDIAPLIAHIGPFIKTLPAPIKVFNWSNSKPGTAQPKSASDPMAIAYANSSADKYWNHYGDRKYSEEEYGLALYVSTDPFATQQDFGDSALWRLLEVQLPTGFRFIDLTASSKLSANDVSLFKQFGCSFSDVESIFSATSLSTTCIAAVKAVFITGLRLQGFSYQYPAAALGECSEAHSAAMVISDKNAFSTSTVRAFIPSTTSDVSERVVLQSMLYRAADEPGNQIPDTKAVGALFQKYPSAQIYQNGNDSNGAYLIISIPGQSEIAAHVPCVTADTSSYPRLISSQWVGPELPHTLLWADLVGMQTRPDIGKWIKMNLYGCQK